jgi:hypothetical protein
MLNVTAHGAEFRGSEPLTPGDVLGTLDALEASLSSRGLAWADVDLLWLSNSKLVSGCNENETRDLQDGSDQTIVDTLNDFAAARDWYPTLIGSTVRAAFFACGADANDDISNGLLWVAICGAHASPVPIGVEISASDELREVAGSRALDAALEAADAYFGANPLARPTDADDIGRSSLGIVLTSGSGHVERKVEIDFKHCYALGQDLKARADALGMMLSGGCASNRSADQSQTLYFSEPDADRPRYAATVKHGAVVALLPFARALLHLEHPYRKRSDDRLNIDFHEHESYKPGRYFCVRRINGMPPSDYLRANGWAITDEELAMLIAEHVAIPLEPKAHKVSIASAPPDTEALLWPNVPVWFEEVDEGSEVVMRLVRAESQESDFYLVEMEVPDLVRNAVELAEAVADNGDDQATLIAFLCESRKYVLADEGSNAEAEHLLSRRTTDSVVGIYLNGEYSTGDFRSIGYHNYSQIGVVLSHT